MPVSTTCPRCKALFRLADEMVDKKVKCQKCQTIFLVPSSDGITTVPGTRVASPHDASASTKPTSRMDATPPAPWLDTPPPPAEVPAHAPPSQSKEQSVEAPLDEETDESEEVDDDHDDHDDRDKRRSAGPRSIAKESGTRRASTKSRRRTRSSGSNTGMMVGIAVLVGGGLLSCILCGGGGLVYWTMVRARNNDGIQVAFDNRGMFRTTNALNLFDRFDAFDPFFGPKRHKVYLARLEAGQTYQIDLMSNDFDAFLHVIDEQNMVIARDDDGGEGLNSRIMLRPPRSGLYRIHATSLEGDRVGNFTLIVNRFGEVKQGMR